MPTVFIYAEFAKNAKPIILWKSVLSPRGHSYQKALETGAWRQESDSGPPIDSHAPFRLWSCCHL